PRPAPAWGCIFVGASSRPWAGRSPCRASSEWVRPSVSASPSTPTKRVLVVDDDRSLTDPLRMVLEDAGYAVTTASNGREAVHAAVTDPPDVVVLDIVMPEMDGWETSDHLLSHERTSKIPIIFLSARTTAEDQLRGWYKGAFDYLTKPFDMQDLLGKVTLA